MLDAVHFVYKNVLATEKAIESFRQFYPSSNYIVMSDNGDNYQTLCERYNCKYIHYDHRLGYPKNWNGYNLEEIKIFLDRFSNAVSLCKASHVLIMEDDVYVLNKIKFDELDEMSVLPECSNHNKLDQKIVDYLTELSGSEVDNFYGLAGGSVFKRESFIVAYEKMKPVIENNFFEIKKIFPEIGWMDGVLSFIMMGAGKRHSLSKDYYDLCKWNGNYTKINYTIVDALKKMGISRVHHYKKYYDFTENWYDMYTEGEKNDV